MKHYHNRFLENIKNQLVRWDEVSQIPHQDVYRFLHSIQGTSGILGLQDISNKAAALVQSLQEESERVWSPDELKKYCLELLQLCYTFEVDSTIEAQLNTEVRINKNAPVILVVDDDAAFLMVVKQALEEEGWQVVPKTDIKRAVQSFYEIQPDCILVDVYMKNETGFELLDFFEEQSKNSFIPTMMISMDHSKKTRLMAYEKGADDFLTKDMEMDELVIRIKRQLVRKKKVDQLLLVDELTKVYNRKFLTQMYPTLLANQTLHEGRSCLAVVDLDHFKNVNDSFGHIVGDKVLQTFAQFLSRNLRKEDFICRYGGEEFVLLFSNLSIEEAERSVNELREQFSMLLFDGGTEKFSCTFSAGLVEIKDVSVEIDQWVDLADDALYVAKESGRNRVKVHQGSSAIGSHRTDLKIAVVDDDPIARVVVKNTITSLVEEMNVRCSVETFSDGQDFVDSNFHQHPAPCIVILDGVMPGLDGLEVLKHIRSLSTSDQYKVIMLTSRQTPDDIAKALHLGADDYMIKPFYNQELMDRVEKWISRSSYRKA
ncbi:diguanylate cyclase [Priestia koreensis]|uniref:diguanylate cyclase n=1 Tax=Priestia koreensis TaxID=284581 RepID=UPI00203A99FD|nr:diguanylate cyclase [Priestia koreensis]